MSHQSNHLDTFREHYPSVKVNQSHNDLVYKVGAGYSDKAAAEANELIDKLNLPLVAIPAKMYPRDSFVVKLEGVEL